MRFSWVDDVGRNEPIDVAVAFNPRRRTRMGISFDQDGTLLVDAPVGTTAAEVRAVLEAHGRWLRYKARSAPDEAATWFPKVYEDGVILFYRGSALTLTTERRRRVVVDGSSLRAPLENTKSAIWDWYGDVAGKALPRRVAELSDGLPWIDESPPVRTRFMKSRWGSCSGTGRVSLNNHLIKLPSELVDYVIVHELCHLQYMNHGPRFYQLLDLYLPDWKERQTSMRHHTPLLAETPP